MHRKIILAIALSALVTMNTAHNASPAPLALPSTPQEGAQTLSVSGDSVTLDHLGPVVINADGTMSRITNWDIFSETERANTMRVIAKRNKIRLAKLQKELEEAERLDANGELLTCIAEGAEDEEEA
ncbi:hypothetical protein HDU98_007849, partial [Podochytrium sp. JEL0797]